MRVWRTTLIRAGLIGVLLATTACNGCLDEIESEGQYFEPREYGSYTPLRVPMLEAPARVSLGDVELGATSTRRFLVRNTGRADLKFSQWSLEGAERGFEISYTGFMEGATPAKLEPGASVEVVVTYTARSPEGQRGELVISSNATNQEVWTVELLANIKEPCLTIEPTSELDFGVRELGSSNERAFTVTSCSQNSETTFTITSGLSGSRAFTLGTDEGRPVTLAPDESREVVVRFSPGSPGPEEARFVLTSDEYADNVYGLTVRGEGAPYDCPRAVIRARLDGREPAEASPDATFYGLPLDRVSLDASGSVSPEGFPIERIEWTLIGRPADSAARLQFEPESIANELWLDLSGDYVVELNVWDAQGARSCEPARMVVKAIPDEDIHVQLVWDTPNDPNQLDSSGSDIDLHLVHESGRWNSRPWDCFWQNIEPDWGAMGSREDDPSLDIDDVDGWGPENINLNNPELNTSYRIGVHYFSAHGYGASLATVRLYLGGALVLEKRRQRLVDQEFWHVLDLEWPTREITEVDRRYETMPMR